MPKAPAISYIYEIDTDTPACAKYEVVSQHPVKVKYLEDLPLESCNGHMAVTNQDGLLIKNYIDDVQDWADKNKNNLNIKL